MEEQEYDTTLTDAHSYLGEGFEDMHGRSLLDDKMTHQMLVLGGRNVTLIPGETLPLLLHHDAGESNEIRTWIKRHKVFGILYPRQSTFGTTADLRGIKEFCNEDGHWTLTVKAVGSQRFKIIEKRIISRVIFMAEVRVLPDLRLLPPAQHLLLGRNKIRNIMGKLTPYPECVFNQCKEDLLMKEISVKIQAVLGKKPPVKDPVGFSYWVAANLPINDSDRKVLLAANTSQERLFIAKHFLKHNCKISCKHCKTLVSTKEKIFSMSSSGAQGTFVNMGGYVHEMLTVRDVTEARFFGASSEEYSWFPGYAWKILICTGCSVHLGWRFSTDKNLQPKKFYGLTRTGVTFVPFDDSKQITEDISVNAYRMSRLYLVAEDDQPEPLDPDDEDDS